MHPKYDLPQIISKLFEFKKKGICRFEHWKDRHFSEMCTFRIGGEVAHTVAPLDLASLCVLIRTLYGCGVPYFVLGGGSNILPPDEGYAGVLILTSRLRGISFTDDRLVASCGAPLNECILRSADRALSGLERLYGIPATVGGAIYMNAGANGCTVSDCLESAELYDPDLDATFVLSPAEMLFSYRESILQMRRQFVVLRATFLLHRDEKERIRQTVRDTVRRRSESQPLQFPSAGSAFKRPRNDTEAWRLIDRCGLRGLVKGGAQISEKHAGFIINCGGATARDVCDLITIARREVLHNTGILLIPEIELLKNGK